MITLAPIHPGEILKEEFLAPLGISNNELAMQIRVPASRIDQITKGNRGITADTALRLAEYFGNTPQFWMNLQSQYDLKAAASSIEQIKREVVRRNANEPGQAVGVDLRLPEPKNEKRLREQQIAELTSLKPRTLKAQHQRAVRKRIARAARRKQSPANKATKTPK